MPWGGRGTTPKYPPSSAAGFPLYSQPLFNATERREVRSETELRQAIADIAASETAALVTTPDGNQRTIRKDSTIWIAAPFQVDGLVTIPEECDGLEIRADGFKPLAFKSGLAVCFRVEAFGVLFDGLTQYIPVGETPPVVFCDLVGAEHMRVHNCFCGGSDFGFRSPTGAAASNHLQFSNVQSGSHVSLNTDNSNFNNFHAGDLTLQATSNNNRFSSCRFSDIVVAGSNNAFGGIVADSASDSAAGSNNAIAGAAGPIDVSAWTGAGSVSAGVT